MSYVNECKGRSKLLEGYLEQKSQDGKWRAYWCVLRGSTIFIFTSPETIQDNHKGTLEINNDTRFIVGDSDLKKESFRFDLRTTKHFNKFKCKKFSERELWRAYIIGISTGSIPDDLDLMKGQICMIRDEIEQFHQNRNQPLLPRRRLESDSSPSPSGGSVNSGFSNPEDSIDEKFAVYLEMNNPSNGGPFMRHKFWNEHDRTDVPSWFFVNCTRELAEKILKKNPEFGNTLMRESCSYRGNGSYTITKHVNIGGDSLVHFEVIRVAAGYKINAENAPQVSTCLSDVMSHFVHLSGAQATKLFLTNNLKKLGLDNPDYQTKIVTQRPDKESGEEEGDSYEEPLPAIDGNKTLPNRLDLSTFQVYKGSRTTAGRDKQNRPGLTHVSQGSHTAGALDKLDTAIDYHNRVATDRKRNSEYPDNMKYLSPVSPPISPTDDFPENIVRKTGRSKSVPHVVFDPSLEQKVPQQNPGVQRRASTNRGSAVPQQYDDDNPYNPRRRPQQHLDYSYNPQQPDDVNPYNTRESDPYSSRDRKESTGSNPYNSRDRKESTGSNPYISRDRKESTGSNPYNSRDRKVSTDSNPYISRDRKVSTDSNPYISKERKHSSDRKDSTGSNSYSPRIHQQIEESSPYQTRPYNPGDQQEGQVYVNLPPMGSAGNTSCDSRPSGNTPRPVSAASNNSTLNLNDIQSQLASLKPTGIKIVVDSPSRTPDALPSPPKAHSPPPVAPKTKAKPQSTTKLTNPRIKLQTMSTNHLEDLYENLEDYPSNKANAHNQNFFNHGDGSHSNSYTEGSVYEDAQSHAYVPAGEDDNETLVSSGSSKDINSNITSKPETCVPSTDRTFIKNKLEMCFGGGLKPDTRVITKVKSAPNLPLPEIPHDDPYPENDSLYEEIPANQYNF
ncbi:uncharacterized protein LOC126817096 isoform X2 [Patella vulgata]|uniref:uncharacterized protein LOC126817096 isoform X2 n=1 Tax=Patella vulgata TaxID=6465 RepID=UPI0024A838B7|nr:uncharacterized protein LOC126817096 isoform X2 [Patella vulgata]